MDKYHKAQPPTQVKEEVKKETTKELLEKDYLYTPWGKQLPSWYDEIAEVRHGYFYALLWSYHKDITLNSGQELEYYEGDSEWIILINLSFWRLKIKEKKSGEIVYSERIGSLEKIEYAINYPHMLVYENRHTKESS